MAIQAKYFTVPQAAARIGKTERAVWQDIYRRRVPHKRWGKRVLVPIDELEEFLGSLPGVSAQEAMAEVVK